MAGTGLLPLVLVMSFGLDLLSGVTSTDLQDLTDCYVQDSINYSVENTGLKASFWGNVKNDHPFMEMKLIKNTNKILDYYRVRFNLTHVDVHDITPTANTPVSKEAIPGLVCQGWRLFHLVLSGRKLLTITDDHNTTWIDKEFNCNISNLTITVDNLKSSCITLTPTWHVVGGTRVDMTLPSPQQQEDLRLILVSRVNNTNLTIVIGSDEINLGTVSPKTPTRLRLKQTPGAAPGKVAANTWEQVIEIGNATSVGVVSLRDILIVLHLNYQACPLSAESGSMGHCCCIPDFVLAFLWIAAVSSVVTFYSLRRIFELIIDQAPSDNLSLRPPSPEAIYEEIITPPWL